MSELKIENIVDELNDKGKGIPKKIGAIESLPYDEFSELLSDIKTGDARLLRFAFALESDLFSLVATKAEKARSTLGLVIAYGGSLVAIGASIFYSWWILAAIPICIIVGMRITKFAYNTAILRSGLSSELIFCFLYFMGQVSVDRPRTEEHFYHKRD
jgi:hypothetical protein